MRLASPIENIKSHYTVVVVGSGYGGGIAASRMSRAGQQVCLLERGKELQPGEYPDTELKATEQMQLDTYDGKVGSPTGLYNFHVNKDISVLVGCGLGGTSLINANVSILPEPRVLADRVWPEEVRTDGLLEQGYQRATEMLKPAPYPAAYPPLAKLQALEESAREMGGKFYRMNINVTFQTGVNHVGVMQNACVNCGDCVTGCNYSAKNTTLMNYLPDAHNHGTEIYTQVHVERVGQENGKWLVYYRRLAEGMEKFNAPLMFVSADIVVLAAGALGSTEILLRSKQAGLALSDALGKRFTGNGDVLGFGYNGDHAINGIGFGSKKPGQLAPCGPCITGVIDLREQPELHQGMVLEEGSIPGAIGAILPGSFALVSSTEKDDWDVSHPAEYAKKSERTAEGLALGPYHGAINNMQTYLVMSHDGCGGEMRLESDRLRIDWPGVGDEPIFVTINDRLKQAAVANGATYVRNPLWRKAVGDSLVTVHPLGGAVMADKAEDGVVNHKNQVFAGTSGTAVYDGFYVADGSVVPTSLGVNPLFTISAVAERACALIAKDRGWEISYDLPSRAPGQAAAAAGIEFTESMKGFFSTQQIETKSLDDYEHGFQAGEQANSAFDFILNIRSENVAEMLVDPNHRAAMNGTVHAPALSAAPLTVTAGEFQLFSADPDNANGRRMWYRMQISSAEGRTYYFSGYKLVLDRKGTNMWTDTTTLFITIHNGDSEAAPVLGCGKLIIHPTDFAKQLTTMNVFNAGLLERVKYTAEFGKFFAGQLFEVYGGILARGSGAGA